ncbi:hypothetical protein D6D54_05600 [Spiroplasma poulsonii]|uniref:Uncharacterized protein n=1 Tax=Spiroplasma poulsonii TaxID=2138 RepID=A0A433EQE1_9MOLU|nr:hypothetical protein [Spiroplasma poulsonii]MBW3057889.1 hypothetical protein [Spiroplasma poulsonii]RUP76655.1 hypothetical protein D6D54_05600 [Spiroplasma poulsonii]
MDVITNYKQLTLVIAKQDFKKMTIKNQKDGLKGVIKIMLDNFKNSVDANDLEDLDLFNLITQPVLSNPQGHSRRYQPDILIWDREIEDKWAVMFTFGNSLDTGLYYSFASNSAANSDEHVDFEVAPKDSD